MNKNSDILLFVAIIISLIFVGILIYQLIDNKSCNFTKIDDFNIPKDDLIDDFCRSKGYDLGYINDYSCDNGIYCFKSYGKFTEYECFYSFN